MMDDAESSASAAAAAAAAAEAAAAAPVATRQYRPYFTAAEIQLLTTQQSMKGRMSMGRVERMRQVSVEFIAKVGASLGFPRRTIATAQTLYHRFHLFFPFQGFSFHQVSLSCLYIASKLHDTLKKPREIVLVSYAIRHPELFFNKSQSRNRLSPLAAAVTMDAQAIGIDLKLLESDRKKVLSIERLVLESCCFNFNIGKYGIVGEATGGDPFRLAIKMGKKIGLSKRATRVAWALLSDVYRTLAPLRHTPQTLVLGCMYGAAILLARATVEIEDEDWIRVRKLFESAPGGEWERTFAVRIEDAEDVVHALLDLFVTLHGIRTTESGSTGPTLSSSSPNDDPVPTMESNSSHTYAIRTAFTLPSTWTPQLLTQEKIKLRERPAGRNVVAPAGTLAKKAEVTPSATEGTGSQDSQGLGDDKATTRFLFV